jgi:hypothetical protein
MVQYGIVRSASWRLTALPKLSKCPKCDYQLTLFNLRAEECPECFEKLIICNDKDCINVVELMVNSFQIIGSYAFYCSRECAKRTLERMKNA